MRLPPSAPNPSVANRADPAPLAWIHGSFRIPPDWEITHYATSETEGRIDFANRHGHQARLTWQPCKRAPDCERIMSSFHERYLLRESREAVKSFSGLRTEAVGRFLLGTHGAENPSLAALTFSGTNYMLSGGSLTLDSSTGTATVLVTSGTQGGGMACRW